jgi:hypothetical protein
MMPFIVKNTNPQSGLNPRFTNRIIYDISLTMPIDIGKQSAIISFKLSIKENFRKSYDILGYTELTLYNNVVHLKNITRKA